MGLFDFLKKKDTGRDDNSNTSKNANERESQEYRELVLNYKSGEQARIHFGDLEEIDGAMMQRAIVMYGRHDREDAVFMGKDILLEPHISEGKDGRRYYDTEEYYNSLASNGKMGVVKGFFKREEVNQRETDYIGMLSFREDGSPTRYENKEFLKNYRETYAKKLEQIRLEKEKIEEKWQKEMQDMVNRIPEPIDNPEDHVVVLSPDMLKENFDKDEETIGKRDFKAFFEKKKKENEEKSNNEKGNEDEKEI